MQSVAPTPRWGQFRAWPLNAKAIYEKIYIPESLPTLMLAAENLAGIGPHDLVRIDEEFLLIAMLASKKACTILHFAHDRLEG